MLIIHHISDNISYLCVWNVQYWARVTKSNMEIQRYNRLKAAVEREQGEVCFNSVKRRESRTKSNISTVSRWMINKVQPSVKPLGLWTLATNGTQELYEITHHLNVDVKEFFSIIEKVILIDNSNQKRTI